MQNRPDLKGLQLQQSAAERFTQAEHDLYFPTVNAIAAAGGVPAGAPRSRALWRGWDQRQHPYLQWRPLQSPRIEAALKAKAAAQNTTDLANRIIRDVRVAWLNASTAFERVALTQELVDQTTQALDLAQRRYQLRPELDRGTESGGSGSDFGANSNAMARYDYQAQRSLVDHQTGALR